MSSAYQPFGSTARTQRHSLRVGWPHKLILPTKRKRSWHAQEELNIVSFDDFSGNETLRISFLGWRNRLPEDVALGPAMRRMACSVGGRI